MDQVLSTTAVRPLVTPRCLEMLKTTHSSGPVGNSTILELWVARCHCQLA